MVYFIAELSSNHGGKLENALQFVDIMKDCGANAIKLQTYTPDTITVPKTITLKDTLWKDYNLYDLYKKSYTPWEWHKEIKERVESYGMDFLSTPFDCSAVDFLESLGVTQYKIASFDITDYFLLERIGSTKKPVIMSTGMATKEEILTAIRILKQNGCSKICILHCVSSYPCPYEDIHLNRLLDLRQYGEVGLSDHSKDIFIPIAGTVMGISVIEKHVKLNDEIDSPDKAFSLFPHEFKRMVDAVNSVQKAMGKIRYGVQHSEEKMKKFRKGIYLQTSIRKGETITRDHLKLRRPCLSIPSEDVYQIIGKQVIRNMKEHDMLTYDDIYVS